MVYIYIIKMPKLVKGSEEAKEHMRKMREGRKSNKEKLIVANTAKIAVPKKMIYVNPKGEKEKVPTLTKKGTITIRDNKPVIKLRPNTQYTLKIVEKGKKRTLNTVGKKLPKKPTAPRAPKKTKVEMVDDLDIMSKADEAITSVKNLKKMNVINK